MKSLLRLWKSALKCDVKGATMGVNVRGSCRQGAIRTRLEQDRLVRETNP
jgi:hypothetical protein